MKNNIIVDKRYKFSLEIIKVYKVLNSQKVYRIADQLLGSGTSIGANIDKAIGDISKKEFSNKMAITYKEARETKYWLLLIRDSYLLDENKVQMLLNSLREILKILGKIRFTTKRLLQPS